jgi:hypothetical protein
MTAVLNPKPANTLTQRPDYNIHRTLEGTPVAAEVALPGGKYSPINSDRFDGLHGFVGLTGGAAPTVTLQMYEIAKLAVDDSTEVPITKGAPIGPISSAQGFSVDEFAQGGRFFFLVSAVTGNPTKVEIFLSGTTRRRTDAI